MAMVSAVAVPRDETVAEPTKTVEAGVTHESVSRVPPTMPMERLSFWGLPEAVGAASGGLFDRAERVGHEADPIDSCVRRRLVRQVIGSGALSPPAAGVVRLVVHSALMEP